MSKPTLQQNTSYQKLYDYFNRHLFKGELSRCMLTLFPNRAANGGHFWPQKWHDEVGTKIHEISLNPQGYSIDDAEHFISILVHEMCHLWIFDNLERPPRAGYHCRKWGAKMEEVGLMPSNTGEPGGKKTGQQMAHYIMEEGRFREVYERMDKKLLLPFKRFADGQKAKKKKSKFKYTCAGCDSNVWGKVGLEITCTPCDLEYEIED